MKEKKEKKAKSQKMDTSGDQGTDKVSESPTIDDVVEGYEFFLLFKFVLNIDVI